MAETPRRFVRVPELLWNAANRKANRENTDLSKVIRAKLIEYVESETSAVLAESL